MKTYAVQMMDSKSYGRYMNGYMDGYHVITIPVIANDVKEAYQRGRSIP